MKTNSTGREPFHTLRFLFQNHTRPVISLIVELATESLLKKQPLVYRDGRRFTTKETVFEFQINVHKSKWKLVASS